jgi:hypothetical protein
MPVKTSDKIFKNYAKKGQEFAKIIIKRKKERLGECLKESFLQNGMLFNYHNRLNRCACLKGKCKHKSKRIRQLATRNVQNWRKES